MKWVKLDTFYRIGLIIVIILLVAVLVILSKYFPETTTTIVTTTAPIATTTPTTTTLQTTTSTSTTTYSTTTQPLAPYGDDIGTASFKPSKTEIHAGNIVNINLKVRNSNPFKTLNITRVELFGMDLQKGNADEDTWGVPEGEYIFTPYEFLYSRETSEYFWILQAPTGIVNETTFFFKTRIHYFKDATEYYTDTPELKIIVNP